MPIIVNNVRLLDNFTPCHVNVKGIGGKPAISQVTGIHMFKIHSDDGMVDAIKMEAMYIPSSPYNILPPQLLIASLKESNFQVDWFKHNDR